MTGYKIGSHSFPPTALEVGLYPVATPIGNLKDITIRALDTLASVDVIACEDTRVTGKLLSRYAIRKPLQVYHEHVHDHSCGKIIDLLSNNQRVALVSDAGTPVVSDPGQALIHAVVQAGFSVYPVPGASAVVNALVGSAITADYWSFIGFLPPKSTARKKMLASLKNQQGSLVFYESPKRIAASLCDLAEILGPGRPAAICRELTKLYEEFNRQTLGTLAVEYASRDVKGEIVIVVGPDASDREIDVDRLLSELVSRMSVSRAAAEAATLTGLSKRDLYQRALELSNAARDQGNR